MKKNTLLFAFTFIILFVSGGCSSEERIATNTNTKISTTKSSITSEKNISNNLSQATKTYKKDLAENLYVDALVDIPDIKKISLIKAESVKFDPIKLLDIFFGSENIKGEKDGAGVMYKFNNKSLMVLEDKTFFDFYTSLKSNIQGVINTLDFGNLYKFTLENLDFMSKQEAINKAEDILKKLNITPYGQPKIYSIDYNTMQQEQEKRLKEGLQGFVDLGKVKLKERWTKDDEFYYLFFKVDINGIPCDNIGYTQMPSGIPVNGSQIEVIVSNNGIELVTPTGTVYKKVGTDGNAKSIISIDGALEAVKKKYENVILTNETVVTDISLIYTPILINPTIDSKSGAIEIKQVELFPCWLLKVQQKNKDTLSSDSDDIERVSNTYIRVNAITGEQIL